MIEYNTVERVVLRTMQERGVAALTRTQIERLANVGSSAVFDDAVARLITDELVVSHRIGRDAPETLSLTRAGRSLKV